MYYTIRHTTRFTYDSPISESVMEARMQPRSEAANATATVRTAPNERRALRVIVGLLVHDATAAASITSNTLHLL